MIFISDVMTFYRRYFRYVVTQTITLSRCHVWHHAYLPMQWASCWSLITIWLKPVTPWRGYFCPLLFSLFSTLPIRREVTEFFYQSDVKEASGMLNVPFGLALIDTLDLIEEAFSKENRVLFRFHYNEWFASNQIPMLWQTILGLPGGKHCKSLERNVWRKVVSSSKAVIFGKE